MEDIVKIEEEHVGKYIVASIYENDLEMRFFNANELSDYQKHRVGLLTNEEYTEICQEKNLKYIRNQLDWLIEFSQISEKGKSFLEEYKIKINEQGVNQS